DPRRLRRGASDPSRAHESRRGGFVVTTGQPAARAAGSHFLSWHRSTRAGRPQPGDRTIAGRLRARRVRAGSLVPGMTQSNSRATRGTILAVTSGKGGVGKTNVVINLAAALSRLGHRVGIVDADFGLGNVDVLLGLTPTHHIGHVLTGEKNIADITIQGPLGV